MTGFGLREESRYATWAAPVRDRWLRWPAGRDRLLAMALVTRGALFAVALAVALWGEIA
jgi:hypothetical protein